MGGFLPVSQLPHPEPCIAKGLCYWNCTDLALIPPSSFLRKGTFITLAFSSSHWLSANTHPPIAFSRMLDCVSSSSFHSCPYLLPSSSIPPPPRRDSFGSLKEMQHMALILPQVFCVAFCKKPLSCTSPQPHRLQVYIELSGMIEIIIRILIRISSYIRIYSDMVSVYKILCKTTKMVQSCNRLLCLVSINLETVFLNKQVYSQFL